MHGNSQLEFHCMNITKPVHLQSYQAFKNSLSHIYRILCPVIYQLLRYWKCDIQGASSGPLFGKKLAIKDNIAVAGIPMMNGSRVLEGYIPEFDATIITRILDAGSQIICYKRLDERILK